MATQEEGASVPVAQKAGWSSFLKSIASFSGDLSSMTAPPFILSPISLAEFPSYWGEPNTEFGAIASGATPEERHYLVLKWFISTLPGQFTRREKETGSEKKPLNPFLGEQFIGEWNKGETKLVAEQVSHHPPITAYFLENATKGVSYQGHCAQKTSFSTGTIVVKQVGHGLLKIKLPSGETETYLITLPKLRIEGLWYGAPLVELTEHSFIQASHGMTTDIEYKGKGWVSGKSHSFTATTKSSSHSSLSTIEGTWTGVSSYTKPSSSPFLDLTHTSFSPIQVAPIAEQAEYESRKAWKDVADGIRKGDFEGAASAKTAIENRERVKRKEEKEKGVEWSPRRFKIVKEDSEYHKLAQMCKHKPEQEESFVFVPAAN